MIKKFAEALSLLWNNLGLFSAITLTVLLPTHLLIIFLAYNGFDTSAIGFRTLEFLIWGIFAPIYIGALVYSLYQIKKGRTVTYGEAMFVGFRKWRNLFAARLVAGIFIAIGLIALIIPGVVLALRYSLLGALVIVEDKGSSESRARSTELTAGRRSQILGAMILFAILSYLLSSLIYLPLRYVESLNVMPVVFVLTCILYVAYSVKQIILFLFYWESIQPIASAEPADGPDGWA